MRTHSEQFFISLSDYWSLVKKRKKSVLFVAVLIGSLALCNQLRKPLHYTVKGVFKGGALSPRGGFPDNIAKIMGFSPDSYTDSNEDALTLLSSYPVLERVVHSLSLQGVIFEKTREGLLKRVWYNLLNEGAWMRFRQYPRPSSPILDKKIPMPDRHLFPDGQRNSPLKDLIYTGEIATTLHLKFHGDSLFTVFSAKGASLGEGSVGQVFEWREGRFTLLEKGNAEQILSLIPLKEATESLQKQLLVRRDKKNPSLVNLQFTHHNRHFATAIVNAAMEAYLQYLRKDGEEKIAHQLEYLARRKSDSLESLEKIMTQQREFLETHLGERGFVSLEKEIEFISRLQAEYQKRLEEIAPQLDTSMLLPKVPTKLGLTAAQKLLGEQQMELDKLLLKQKGLQGAHTKASNPDFPLLACAPLIEDPSLKGFFEHIEKLHHKLVDASNWSAREKELIAEELKTERAYLLAHIAHLQEANQSEQLLTEEKIEELKRSIQQKLQKEYAGLEKRLADLNQKAAHFPEKWLSEQKLAVSTQLSREIVESISKMIEAKNIAYHTESLNSKPFRLASPPILPDAAKLRFMLFLGASSGAFFYLLYLFLKVAAEGPSASVSNLRGVGFSVIEVLEELPFLYDHSLKTLYITEESVARVIQNSLKEKGEEVSIEEGTAAQKEGKNKRALLVTPPSAPVALKQHLVKHCDQVLYVLAGEEKLSALNPFPVRKTRVYVPPSQDEKQPLPTLEPLLNHLKRQTPKKPVPDRT